MVLPTFEPSNAGAQLQQQALGMAEGFQNIYARAEAMKQSRERLDMEKSRFAREASMAALDTKEREARLKQVTNQLELQDRSRDAALKKIDLEKKQAEDDIAKSIATEELLASAPSDLKLVDQLDPRDLHSIRIAKLKLMQKYGKLTDDPRFLKLAGTSLANLAQMEVNASQVLDGDTAALADEIDVAAERGDRAALDRLRNDPRYTRARNAMTAGGQMLQQKFSALSAQKTKANTDVEVAGGKARAEAQASGGKPLTDTLTGDLSAYRTAVADVKKVSAAFDKISKDWRTGPITNRVAGWSTTWNKDFKVLESLITETVPNLARGVFRERGVLTNEDVERYTALLPNAKADPEVARALFVELNDKLEKSFELNLDTLERAGYNVRGFDDLRAKKPTPADGTAAQRIAQGI